MMIAEQRRHHMVDALIAAHGEEVAMTMTETIFSMEHATKTDLTALETRMDEKFATKADLHAMSADFEKALHAQTRHFVGGVAALLAMAGAVSHFFG